MMKGQVEVRIFGEIQKKHERPTRGIANKGFRGMRRVVARFNPPAGGCTLIEIARNPLLAISPPLGNSIENITATLKINME